MVDPDIDKGYRLIRALDNNNLRPSAALWLLEDSVWRLLLEVPVLRDRSIAIAYKEIQRVIRTSPGSYPELTEVTLVDSNSELLRVLRSSFSSLATGQPRIHLTRTRLMGIYIEEVYVYRL